MTEKAKPYRCPACLTEKGCGYHGVLRFPTDRIPVCDHHDKPVEMVEVPRRA